MSQQELNGKAPEVVWSPTSTDNQMEKFRRTVNKNHGLSLKTYWDLYEWSVECYPEFWEELWNYVGIIHSEPYIEVVDRSAKIEDVPMWFTGARLNYTENLLRHEDDMVAFYVADESRKNIDKVTFGEVRREVAVYASALKKAGVKPGDRISGYISCGLPAAYAFLAGGAVGAVWSAVSLEFGLSGVVDRLQQTGPKVLFAVDYAEREGKGTNYLDRLKNIVKELPMVEKVVVCPFYGDLPKKDIEDIPNSCLLSEFLQSGKNPDGSQPSLEYVQLPACHPVIISFTSGTTGPPKGLLHSSSALLLQTMKEWLLHANQSKGDVVEIFSTVGWAAWNMFMTTLSLGITVLLYNGSPLYPSASRIWDFVDDIGVTFAFLFPYMLDRCEKEGIKPKYSHKLEKLRVIGMGASCPKPQNWEYIHRDVKADALLASSLGATDILACFASLNFCLPVHVGEIQAPSLGMAVECFNDEGQSVLGEIGELVVTKPFPSMPLEILNDPYKAKYKKTYFSKFSGVWVQGDLCMINPVTRGIEMLGRSDAVLNPKGRRFGTSEIYNIVEKFGEVMDSVCVAQYNQNKEERVILFLKMSPGQSYTQELAKRMQAKIKEHLTEKHSPDIILEVKDIPYTATGKKMELAVKAIINGKDLPGKGAIVNPNSLDLYRNIPELQSF